MLVYVLAFVSLSSLRGCHVCLVMQVKKPLGSCTPRYRKTFSPFFVFLVSQYSLFHF